MNRLSERVGETAPVRGSVFAPIARRRPFALVPVLAAVAAAGALGAAARYLAWVAWPSPSGAFPLNILGINVAGCAAIGVLMVVVVELWPHRPLVRPFLGTGLLGGFTTFSAYAMDVEHLARLGAWATAAAYLVATPVLGVLAAALMARLTRLFLDRGSP